MPGPLPFSEHRFPRHLRDESKRLDRPLPGLEGKRPGPISLKAVPIRPVFPFGSPPGAKRRTIFARAMARFRKATGTADSDA